MNRVIKIEDGKTCSMLVELENQFSVLVRIYERKTPIQRHGKERTVGI